MQNELDMEGIQLIQKLEKDKFVLRASKDMYCNEAILATAYKFGNFFYFNIDSVDLNYYEVFFTSKIINDENRVNSLINEFCNELIDQQIRFNLDKSNSSIKALIIKKAFFPFQENE